MRDQLALAEGVILYDSKNAVWLEAHCDPLTPGPNELILFPQRNWAERLARRLFHTSDQSSWPTRFVSSRRVPDGSQWMVYQTQDPTLPSVGKPTGSRRWRFRHPSAPGQPSGQLLVTTNRAEATGWKFDAGIKPELSVKAADHADAKLSLVQGSAARVTNTLYALEDPPLRVDVLLPWGDDDSNLASVIRETAHEAAELGVPHLESEPLEGRMRELGVIAERPEGWSVEPERSELFLEPTQVEDVGVRVFTPTPGRTYVALRLTDPETGSTSISDLLEIVCAVES